MEEAILPLYHQQGPCSFHSYYEAAVRESLKAVAQGGGEGSGGGGGGASSDEVIRFLALVKSSYGEGRWPVEMMADKEHWRQVLAYDPDLREVFLSTTSIRSFLRHLDAHVNFEGKNASSSLRTVRLVLDDLKEDLIDKPHALDQEVVGIEEETRGGGQGEKEGEEVVVMTGEEGWRRSTSSSFNKLGPVSRPVVEGGDDGFVREYASWGPMTVSGRGGGGSGGGEVITIAETTMQENIAIRSRQYDCRGVSTLLDLCYVVAAAAH